MKLCYCLREYHNFGTSKLDTFVTEVLNGIYSNVSVFATPPIASTVFESTQATFSTAAAEYKQFGITKKTAFFGAKDALMYQVDQTAEYVDSIAQGDISVIALAGFTPSREQFQRVQPLEKISAFLMRRSDVSGEIIVEIPAIVDKGSISYSCVCVEGAPLSNTNLINGQIVLAADDPKIHQDCNKSRRKVFQALTPGLKYYFYVFASNSISVSPLSDPKSLWVS